MDFAKSDIQTMLLDSAERLLAEQAHVEYWREQFHSATGFDEARWGQFAELGWLALPVAEAAGGLGGSIEDVALLNVALGKALAKEPYVSSVVVAAHILSQAEDQTRAEDLLGGIAGGTTRVALGHLENGAAPLATDSAATVARADGHGYLLTGKKILALDAPSAQHLIVSARIEGESGVALFIVDAETPGLQRESYPLIDGTRAADVHFTDLSLPAEALLVPADRGAEVLAEGIDRGMIALMAQAVGAMEAANAVCGAYVRERRQFGTAIGSFQAIQHIMADNFVAAHQARSMLYHALANADQPPAKRAAALSAARIVIGDAGQLVSRNGIQVHGGYGLTDEYAIGHYFRRLMCIEKLHGDLVGHVERFGQVLFD